MLSKVFQRSYIPPVPARAEVPYRPAFTVCQPTPAPGHWEVVCIRVTNTTRIVLPPGAKWTPVYDERGGMTNEIYICVSTWKPTGPPGPTVCTTYPAQPHVPAVPARAGRTEITSLIGWNAGANSVVSHAGDCVCTFNMDRVVGAVCGFTADLDDVADIERLTHAFHFTAGRFQVVESGEARTIEASYRPGDEFKIQRAGGEVSYLHAGALVYTSRIHSVGEIHVGSALYASGDTVGGSE